MPITLAVHGRSPITVGDEEISLGSDPGCQVSFADVEEIKPNHAVIREIGGKWLIEAREAESLVVGDAKPARIHYLKPGDVIRLTENSPPVTFQPIDDILPVAIEPDVPSMRLLLDDDDPPISKSIRTQPPPSSGTIRATGSETSGKSGAVKPPSSGTIRSVKSSTDGSSPAKRSNAKTTQGAKRSGSSGQIPVHKPTDDEVDADLPVLQRTSSWDDLPEVPRRRRSSDQEEMQWIMMIVGRCVAGGLALLVLWLLTSFLWRALSQPSSGLPSVDNNQETPVTNVAPVPATVQPPSRPKPPPVDKSSEVEASSQDEKSDDPAPSEKKEGDASDDDDPMEMESDPSMIPPPVEKTATNDDSDDTSKSPILQATVDSLYAIILEDPDGSGQCQIGTAWAASDRHLVTSASIATMIEKNRKQKRVAFAYQPTSKQKIPIKVVRVHATYRQATEAAEEAADLAHEKKLENAQKMQLRYNLAVLDVNPTDALDSQLPLFTRPLKNTKETSFTMVGFPFENEDDDSAKSLTFKSDVVGSPKERRSKKLAAKTGTMPKNSKELGVTVQFSTTDEDWSGCPIVNKDHKVVGIYGELPQPKGANGKRPTRERAVVSILHLLELAPEINLHQKRLNDE